MQSSRMNSALKCFILFFFFLMATLVAGWHTKHATKKFSAPADDAELTISAELGGNSPAFLYSIEGNHEVGGRRSSPDDDVLDEVPRDVEERFFRGHPIEQAGNDEKFVEFAEEYLDVVKQMRRLCASTKANGGRGHREGGRMERQRRRLQPLRHSGSGGSRSRRAIDEDDYYKAMLCSTFDDY